MYRSVALAALERRRRPRRWRRGRRRWRVPPTSGSNRASVLLDGRDVADRDPRAARVTAAVSQVSAHPAVRARAGRAPTGLGRRARRGSGRGSRHRHGGAARCAAEGVHHCDATRSVPARRQRDEVAAARTVAVDDVRGALSDRDQADATLGRATCPEDAAPDAVVVDTSDVTADEVIAEVVATRPSRCSGDLLPVRARSRVERVQGRVPGARGRQGPRAGDRRVHRRPVAPVDPRRPVRRVHHAPNRSGSSPRTTCSTPPSAPGSSTRSARSRSSAAPPTAPRCACLEDVLAARRAGRGVPRGHPPLRARDREAVRGCRVPGHQVRACRSSPSASVGASTSSRRARSSRASTGSRCRSGTRSRRRCSRVGPGARPRPSSPSSSRSSCSAASTTPNASPGRALRSAREDAGGVDPAIVGERTAGAGAGQDHRAAPARRGRAWSSARAARGGRREVLVFVGDVHRDDAVGGRKPRDHRLHEVLGCAGARGDADDARDRRARRRRARRARRCAAPSGTRPPPRPWPAPACSTSWRCRSRRWRRPRPRSPAARPGGSWSRSRGRCGSRSTGRGTRRGRDRRCPPSRAWRASSARAAPPSTDRRPWAARVEVVLVLDQTDRVRRHRERARCFVVARGGRRRAR